MKKFIFVVAALSMLATTSCDTDVDDTTTTLNYDQVLNYVTPLDGQTTPFITDAKYSYFFNLSKGTASVTMDGLSIDNVKYSFSTDTVGFTQYSYALSGSGYSFINRIPGVKGNVNRDAMLPVSGFNCDMVGAGLYYWKWDTVLGIDNPTLSSDGTMIVMKYNIGNEYSIKTVQPDAFFCGTTNTYVGAGQQAFESTSIMYRVKLNKDKGYKTADVIIYNAKFSENAPALTAVVLEDLEVKFSAGTYTIEGADLIPKCPDGAVLLEQPNYPFEQFSMDIYGEDLTQAVINYKVNLNIEREGQVMTMDAVGNVSDASYLVKIQTSN